MLLVAVSLATLVLLSLSAFQITLAAGAPFGRFAWGGASRVLPVRQRIASVASLAIYGLMASFSAAKGRLRSDLAGKLDRTRHLDHRLLSCGEHWIERNVEEPRRTAGHDTGSHRSCDPVLYRLAVIKTPDQRHDAATIGPSQRIVSPPA
ncbi:MULTISPECIES: hypothetical protein [Rhizobium/Agrobacterium group]|uniref:hypothetical protein n=1 Tax=Rhizobium/Agrobacterium group TaxID=227290 RepID=UPI001F206D79|nr:MULTISPECIES: hypothetical protein [Rhizobium/Agrobacterium group]